MALVFAHIAVLFSLILHELFLILLPDGAELLLGDALEVRALVDGVLDLEDGAHDSLLQLAIGLQNLCHVVLNFFDRFLRCFAVSLNLLLSHLLDLLISICVYRLLDDCFENVRVSFAIHRHETFADLAEYALRLLLSLNASLVTEHGSSRQNSGGGLSPQRY